MLGLLLELLKSGVNISGHSTMWMEIHSTHTHTTNCIPNKSIHFIKYPKHPISVLSKQQTKPVIEIYVYKVSLCMSMHVRMYNVYVCAWRRSLYKYILYCVHHINAFSPRNPEPYMCGSLGSIFRWSDCSFLTLSSTYSCREESKKKS